MHALGEGFFVYAALGGKSTSILTHSPRMGMVSRQRPHFKSSRFSWVDIRLPEWVLLGRPIREMMYVCASAPVTEEALSRTTKRSRKALGAQPVPVSVPKGVGHLLGVSSRKTEGQSEKSSVTGEEKLHQQNACPHIIGGIHDTFLLKKEH